MQTELAVCYLIMNDCVPQREHSFVIPDWIKIQIDVTDYPLKDPILILLYLDVTCSIYSITNKLTWHYPTH